MGKQLRHTRHTLGMLIRPTDFRLRNFLMPPLRTAGVSAQLIQCTGTVPFHFSIELSGRYEEGCEGKSDMVAPRY